MLKRIQDDAIPERAMSTGGFWGKVLVTNKEWNTVLKRIQDDAIPERAMSTDGF